MIKGTERLDGAQRRIVDEWLGDGEVAADHSWGQTDTVVLEVESAHGRFVVKAGGPENGHIPRKVRGHREWTAPWVTTGHATRLVGAVDGARVLAVTHLPGRLVESTPAQDDPDTYRQAGPLIADFDAQHADHDPSWNDRIHERALRFLAMPHRIDPHVERRVRAEVDFWPGGGATVAPRMATTSRATGSTTTASCG